MDYLPIAIAGLAVLIAYGQYRTARQKLIIDLFDKRVAAYKKISDQVRDIRRIDRSDGINQDDIRYVNHAIYDMEYLYGEDVLASCLRVRERVLECMYAEQRNEDAMDRMAHEQETAKMFLTGAYTMLDSEFNELSRLVRPYILMNHRSPRTFVEWALSLFGIK